LLYGAIFVLYKGQQEWSRTRIAQLAKRFDCPVLQVDLIGCQQPDQWLKRTSIANPLSPQYAWAS
jgi:hypothetical protein